jgi:hypothetical protein
MAVKLSPFGPNPQWVDGNGDPAVGYQLFFYAAGSSTKQNTYTDSTGNTANDNPIVLNVLGQSDNAIWFTEGLDYKAVLAPENDTDPPTSAVWTRDNLEGINDAVNTADQWTASGLTPAYVSATSFTLVGDQTTAFHIGRRLKSTVTAGTAYSTISNAVFGALTTITVVNDSGSALDSGLSAVSYGLLTNTNNSIPIIVKEQPDSQFRVVGSSDATKKISFEVDGLTTATTRVITMPDFDVNLGIVGLSEDTTPDSNADFLATYDASATGLKKVLLGRVAAPTQGTAQASTSGTAINFTSIPAWVKRLTLSFAGVSISGTNDILVRLGDAGGLEATGYLSSSSLSGTSSVATVNSTTDFRVTSGANAAIWHGSVTFTLVDASTNTWAASGSFARSDAERVLSVSGSKPLSATLDRVGILPSGADTFDAGTINIQYE